MFHMATDKAPRKRAHIAISQQEQDRSSKRYKLETPHSNKELVSIPDGAEVVKTIRKERYKQLMLSALKREKEIYFTQLKEYSKSDCQDCDDCTDLLKLNKPC
eukprot:TRINITY_DN5458_c0_g3_i1.p1 TRINITY_DN5458_c0_g3~~TRINITY_DN5458_c0_g3_i1.p1  ORF type:complete len:103 (+),score=30.24 TRINITY_DN5458_c0_g3_i1:124-432(+)